MVGPSSSVQVTDTFAVEASAVEASAAVAFASVASASVASAPVASSFVAAFAVAASAASVARLASPAIRPMLLERLAFAVFAASFYLFWTDQTSLVLPYNRRCQREGIISNAVIWRACFNHHIAG